MDIRRLRKAKGLTQGQLAELVDVTGSQISLIESGKRYPSFELLLKMGEVFGCSVDDIIRENEKPVITEDDGNEDLDEFISIVKELNEENAGSLRDFARYLLQRQRNG